MNSQEVKHCHKISEGEIKMYKLIMLIAMMLLFSGCSISQHVEQADISNDAEVCIIENSKVREGFLFEFEKVLREKGIKYVVTDRGHANQNCQWTVTYVARWSWDLALYMSYAEIKVYKDGVLDGEAVYDSTRGGANMGKFIDSEPKIRELVVQLMQRDSANKSTKATQSTQVELNKAQVENENPNKSSYIDELKALATIRDDGIITEDEFQKQKTEILNRK
jgi:hypothetical protein